MSEFTLLTWDGGGNVAVMLGIALALRTRGHRVAFAGPRSVRGLVEQTALTFVELGILPPRDPQQRLEYLLAVGQGTDSMLEELRRLAGRSEVLVLDCNLSWAMQSRLARRTAVLVHSALGIYLPVWQEVLDIANVRRDARGQSPLAQAADAWASFDLLLVSSLAHFDRPLPTNHLRPVYVGPVSAPHRQDASSASVLAPDSEPRVLVSYSTDSLQNSPMRLQTALDALADLPVSVVATTSSAFDAGGLRVPLNATVVDHLPHDSVMATAALVICHAGHGTTMAALTSGVPLVCVPGLGRDQEPIAARVAELGLGIALQRDATASSIRNATGAILGDRSYRDRAREFAQRSGRADGAKRAATELVALL